MLSALAIAIIVYALSFALLLLIEKLIHRLTHNPDISYRWGVWLFSILMAIYAFMTNLGR